ncbi:glycosyltransferase family 39 protein [Gloeobacter violaceus]|uniref:Gll4244 protein n=1 Tax=Gloeobacter violaceus (strain ATCC 29082 / PCC 7421) TaxID=251221 RepID=Q7NDJ1_GLOVI|nr:glycosyltransferase family 39 protein [Gloeobacter violaceus]BAC92185.1 gll4244 [Gloeobacter violaceus PCC 7421]
MARTILPSWKDVAAIVGLALVWCLLALLVNPVGNFPLNDDWAYAKAVQSILDQGDLQLTDWAPASQIAQVLWGSLFCLPGGFSFTALRLSTLVLAWVGAASTYALGRELGAGPPLALLGALLLTVNPIYVDLAFTFMTDVPFYAFCTPAIWLFIRGIRTGSSLSVVLGTLFACAAVLTRQFALALPLAFAAGYLVKHGLRVGSLLKAAWPAAAVMITLAIYQGWLAATGRLPQTYSEQAGELVRMLLSAEGLGRSVRSLAQAALYVGLFLVPWLIPVAAGRWRQLAGREKCWAAGAGGLFAAAMVAIAAAGKTSLRDALIPQIFGGVLYDCGAGFPILKDTFTLWLPHIPTAPVGLWLAVTTLGALGAGLIAFVAAGCDRSERWRLVFAWVGIALYFVLIAPRTASYDRYLLYFFPLVMIFARVPPPRAVPGALFRVALALILGYGVFAAATTHDYLAWNRVRWQVLRSAMAEGRLSPTNTDGGFEFNGWYLYDSKYRAQPGKSWWWVDRDEFVFAFGPIDGYTIYERHRVERWMPVGVQEVFILRRSGR